jgi:hypothetical protein
MAQEAPATDPLRLFLSGKRRHARVAIEFAVRLTHGETRLQGLTMDLSKGGVLVSVSHEDMQVVGDDPQEILSALVAAFCQGFDIHFTGRRLKVPAEMVRLSLPTGRAEGDFYLGCRFQRPLSGRQQRSLGIHELDPIDESATETGAA